MVGPYVSAELAPSLFFTGRIAWGGSKNSAEIDVFEDGTRWSGDFDTDRFLARASIYGQIEKGTMSILPQIDLAYMHEEQEDFTVTDGPNSVEVPGVTAELGRLSLSATVEWNIGRKEDGAIYYVKPQVDWDFKNTASATLDDRLRGSLEFGVRTAPKSNWQGALSLRYDGIGGGDMEAVSVRAALQMRM